MRATAIVPVKRFSQAKSRLMEAIDARQRALLLRSMLDDVLCWVSQADGIERLIVVTSEGRAEHVALERAKRTDTAIEVLREQEALGHSGAATLGIVRAKALGAQAVALLPGDCPLLDPAELDDALARLDATPVLVAPDRHGEGTNGLLMRPPDAISPAFGPGSRSRHLERAAARGLEASAEPVPSLTLDLDTPDDLVELAAAIGRTPDRAPSTAAAIEQLRPSLAILSAEGPGPAGPDAP